MDESGGMIIVGAGCEAVLVVCAGIVLGREGWGVGEEGRDKVEEACGGSAGEEKIGTIHTYM